MKRSITIVSVFVFFGALLVAGAPTAQAQTAASTPAPAATPAPPTSGARAEFLRLMEDAETKLVRLAEAIPAEKYAWRPGDGVRSVSELFLHVAGGNFNIPRRVGTEPPVNFKPQGFDTSTTEKAKVVETLKQSFEHVRQAAMKLTDADLEKTSPWFGNRQATYREILFFLATHEHEHLGQAIAYARMIGVAPPWTVERQAQQQKQQEQPKPRQ